MPRSRALAAYPTVVTLRKGVTGKKLSKLELERLCKAAGIRSSDKRFKALADSVVDAAHAYALISQAIPPGAYAATLKKLAADLQVLLERLPGTDPLKGGRMSDGTPPGEWIAAQFQLGAQRWGSSSNASKRVRALRAVVSLLHITFLSNRCDDKAWRSFAAEALKVAGIPHPDPIEQRAQWLKLTRARSALLPSM